MELQRYEDCKTLLNEHMQSSAAYIRKYYTALNDQKPQLIMKANYLWELEQRRRLIAGTKEAAGAALLSACQDAYQPIYQGIMQLHEMLSEITSHVASCEGQRQALTEELCQIGQIDRRLLVPLDKWSAWLAQSLIVLQTQTKYLELHSHLLLPKLLQSSTVQQFKNDLELAEHNKASLSMGLAIVKLMPVTTAR